MTGAPDLTGRRGVASCARSHAHVRVRSLPYSKALCRGLAVPGATISGFRTLHADVPGASVR